MAFSELPNSKYRIETYRNRSEIEANLIDIESGEVVQDRILVSKKKGSTDIEYLSNSRIEAYCMCPYAFKQEFIDKTLDTSSFFTKQGQIFHSVNEELVQNYMDTGLQMSPKPLLAKYFDQFEEGYDQFMNLDTLLTKFWSDNTIANWQFLPAYVEKEFSMDIDDVHVSGIIDMIAWDKYDETVGWIIDWKSNIQPWTVQELKNSLQLQMYTIACQQMFPHIKTWKCAYGMLRYGWQYCPIFTDDQLDSCKRYIVSVAGAIKNDSDFEPRLNRYCQYRECRHKCQTFQHCMANKVDDVYPVDFEELCKQRDHLLAIEKNANGKRKELDAEIRNKIEELRLDGKELIVGDKLYYLDSIARPVYNYADVYRVLLSQNKLDMLDGNIAIADNTSFDHQVNALQDFMLKIQLLACKVNGFSTTYVKSKVLKKEK